MKSTTDSNIVTGWNRGQSSRNGRLCVILLSLLLFASLPIAAESLSINEAFDAAKANSQSYLLSLQQYQDYVNEENTVNPFVPSLSLTGSLSTGAGFIPSISYSGIGYSVGASASLSLGPTIYNDKYVKNANNQAKLLSLFSTEETLYTNVSTAYLNVLLYREAVKVSEKSLETAQAQYDSIAASYEAGQSSELELKQAENLLQNEEYDNEQNKSSLASAERAFKVLTGVDISSYELMSLDDLSYLELPSPEEIFNNYKENSNAIQSARNSVTVAELTLQTTKNSAYIPTVTIGASYTNSGSGIASYNYTTTGKRYSDSLSASVAVSVPLDGYFPGSSSNVGVKSAENSADYARTNLEIAYEDLSSSIEDSVASLNLLENQITLLSRQVDTLTYQASLSQDAYEAGLMSLSDLQDVYDSLQNGEYSLLSAKVSYISAVNELATLIGLDGEEIYSEF